MHRGRDSRVPPPGAAYHYRSRSRRYNMAYKFMRGVTRRVYSTFDAPPAPLYVCVRACAHVHALYSALPGQNMCGSHVYFFLRHDSTTRPSIIENVPARGGVDAFRGAAGFCGLVVGKSLAPSVTE